MRLIEVDNDNAVLVYTGTAYREADAPAFVGAMSSAYHRTDGGWKLAVVSADADPRVNCSTRPDERVQNGCAAGYYSTNLRHSDEIY